MLLLSRRGNARAPAAPRGVRGKERSEQQVKTSGDRPRADQPRIPSKKVMSNQAILETRLAKVRLRVRLV